MKPKEHKITESGFRLLMSMGRKGLEHAMRGKDDGIYTEGFVAGAEAAFQGLEEGWEILKESKNKPKLSHEMKVYGSTETNAPKLVHLDVGTSGDCLEIRGTETHEVVHGKNCTCALRGE